MKGISSGDGEGNEMHTLCIYVSILICLHMGQYKCIRTLLFELSSRWNWVFMRPIFTLISHRSTFIHIIDKVDNGVNERDDCVLIMTIIANYIIDHRVLLLLIGITLLLFLNSTLNNNSNSVDSYVIEIDIFNLYGKYSVK